MEGNKNQNRDKRNLEGMLNKKVICEIRSGDEKAFRVLYELYFFKVSNYAYKLLHSREDAREIAQDVFVKLWNKRCELDPEQSISGLIFRIAKFLAIDKIRKEVRAIKTSSISEAFEVEEKSLEADYLTNELHSIYLGIVEKLPVKRKLIFQLSRNSRLSHIEIAQELNISIKTVEAQIRLALQQIREEITRYSGTIHISLITLFFVI